MVLDSYQLPGVLYKSSSLIIPTNSGIYKKNARYVFQWAGVLLKLWAFLVTKRQPYFLQQLFLIISQSMYLWQSLFSLPAERGIFTTFYKPTDWFLQFLVTSGNMCLYIPSLLYFCNSSVCYYQYTEVFIHKSFLITSGKKKIYNSLCFYQQTGIFMKQIFSC